MDKKIQQLKGQDRIQKIINSTLVQTQNENLQETIEQALDNLDSEHALLFLNSLQTNSHLIYCHKAQVYTRLQNYKLAFEMCAKAIGYFSPCLKCIQLYIKLYYVLLPRKLLFLDHLLQKCHKKQIAHIQIFQSLGKIKQSQNLDQNFQDFLSDLEQSGAEFSKLSIVSHNTDNRTVIARAQIQKDQTILFIPKNKLILLENARQSKVVKKIHQQRLYLRSPKHCELTVFLLQQAELGQKSAFRHYLGHFPKNFDSFPVNYKEQELQYLKGSPFLEQVEQKKVDIKRDYEAICSIWPQFSRYQFCDFQKYRLLVGSRIFGIIVGKLRTDALAPLADMLNHHIPKQTSWFYSDQNEGFMIKSLKKIQKGEQIYDSYGQKCNSRFLLNYGFTILQNEVNEVSIKIPFQYQQEQKVQIYRQITLKVSKNIESKQFEQLISIMRHSVIRQTVNPQQWCIDTIKETPFIDLDIEAQIWQKLEKILQAQLAAYPTTLKEDQRLLAVKDLTPNHFNSVVLRKGEKQILHYYLAMAKKMIKYLCGNAILKGFDQLKEYESYLKRLNFP